MTRRLSNLKQYLYEVMLFKYAVIFKITDINSSYRWDLAYLSSAQTSWERYIYTLSAPVLMR